MVLGGHGDTMVPLVSYTTVSGIPVTQLLDKAKLDRSSIARATAGRRSCFPERPDRLITAPSFRHRANVESIVLDQKRLLPCAAWLEGEYGLSGMYCGVPCQAREKTGLEKIIEVQADGR